MLSVPLNPSACCIILLRFFFFFCDLILIIDIGICAAHSGFVAYNNIIICDSHNWMENTTEFVENLNIYPRQIATRMGCVLRNPHCTCERISAAGAVAEPQWKKVCDGQWIQMAIVSGNKPQNDCQVFTKINLLRVYLSIRRCVGSTYCRINANKR